MKNKKTKQERFDYFAGLAMQSFIATTKENVDNFDEDMIKIICFVAREFAKEMIEQIDENEQI
jgi:hypothetical protein